MAGLQLGVVLLLGAVSAVVETRELYFWQPWAYKEATAEIATAQRMPWDVLFLGSSQVYNGIIPAAVDAELAQKGVYAQSHDLAIFGAIGPTDRLVYELARKGHRPRVVIIGLAARDLNGEESRDRLKASVESAGSLREAVRLASASPWRRFRLPWYALRRDLSVPVQAAATHLSFEEYVREVARQRGSAWAEDAVETPFAPHGKWARLQSVANGLADYDGREFAEQAVDLVEAIRADGAAPLILVMPSSDWADAQLPEAATRDFEDALGRIRAKTAVRILRATELVPALRFGRFYWDHVDHLAVEGARALSRAVGDALLTDLPPSTAR
jgi:hypothetical protein